jgi:hypothetical protein
MEILEMNFSYEEDKASSLRVQLLALMDSDEFLTPLATKLSDLMPSPSYYNPPMFFELVDGFWQKAKRYIIGFFLGVIVCLFLILYKKGGF